MARNALPCIACGKALRNAFDDATNQPEEGLAFESHGHYGSTAFDPMDGTYIEISVCDECLIRARAQGQVLHGMTAKQVVCEGIGVGWTRTNRPLLPWTGEEKPAHADPRPGENVLAVDLTDVGNHELYPEITWRDVDVLWARDGMRAEVIEWWDRFKAENADLERLPGFEDIDNTVAMLREHLEHFGYQPPPAPATAFQQKLSSKGESR